MVAWIFIIGLSLVLVVSNFYLAYSYRNRYKFIRHQLAVEKTQSNFANARYELVKGMFKGEIDSNSSYVKLIYKLNTAFMRNPDKYKAINNVLIDFITTANTTEFKSEEDQSLNDFESESFEKATRLTAEALGSFIIDYSWFWNHVYKFAKILNSDLEPSYFLMLPFIPKSSKERLETEQNAHVAQEVLKHQPRVHHQPMMA